MNRTNKQGLSAQLKLPEHEFPTFTERFKSVLNRGGSSWDGVGAGAAKSGHVLELLSFQMKHNCSDDNYWRVCCCCNSMCQTATSGE